MDNSSNTKAIAVTDGKSAHAESQDEAKFWRGYHQPDCNVDESGVCEC